jgi:NAD+ synthase
MSIDRILPLPPIEVQNSANLISAVLESEIIRTGFSKAVLGISGGIDSALSLAFIVKAIGKENVLAVRMPYESSSPDSLDHAALICNELGVSFETINITSMVEGLVDQIPDCQGLRKGNVMARVRMVTLYDFSAAKNALVIGTSNKTEALLGYSTLWGDMACAINPLGDLYKNQVRQLSTFLNIPEPIIEKPPSADLWVGQTDEAEMDLSYDLADRLLYQLIDKGTSESRLREHMIELGLSLKSLERVVNKVRLNQYKRLMPIIVKVSDVTIGREFRFPRDWGT